MEVTDAKQEKPEKRKKEITERKEDATDQEELRSQKTNQAEKVDQQTKQKNDENNDVRSNASEPTSELNEPVGGQSGEETRGDADIPDSEATAGDFGGQSFAGAHRYALRD